MIVGTLSLADRTLSVLQDQVRQGSGGETLGPAAEPLRAGVADEPVGKVGYLGEERRFRPLRTFDR